MIDVPDKDLNTVKEIPGKYVPGMEVRVFGSRVNGCSKSYSDLDLAIVDKEEIPRPILIQLKDAFQESNLPFRVDIIEWNKITPEFQNIINQNYQLLKPN